MENNAVYYLAIAIFVCYGFNLAQGLKAINRNETVRVIPKVFLLYLLYICIINWNYDTTLFLPINILLAWIYYIIPDGNDLVSKNLKNNLEKKYDC